MLDLLIAAPANATHLEKCLRALCALADHSGADLQISVAHAGSVAPELESAFPSVHWIVAGPRATLPQLWGQAIAATSGQWIAILDAECPVSAGWLLAALDLCATVGVLYGGAVEPSGLASSLAWAGYFCDYGAFMLPLSAGRAGEVAGNNLLLRRDLLALAPQYAGPQFWKAHFVRALQALGVAALNAPGLVVYYERRYTLRAWLYRRMIHARCFAAMRVAGAPLATRLKFVLLAPALPAVLMLRLLRRVLPKRRHMLELWLSLPWIIAGAMAWALGEGLGYALGAGKACEQIY